MAGDIFFSRDYRLCWTGSVGLVTEWAWFLLNHDYERKLPIDYVADLAPAHLTSAISFTDFFTCETELLSIQDFCRGMKLFREWENQRQSEGKPPRFCGSCPECLDKPLAMAEVRLEQVRQEKENGTWTPTEYGLKSKEVNYVRYKISSDSISLREGLVWQADPSLANKAIGRILNKDHDALLPLVTTYELVTDRKEVRFNIHKEFDAELDSVTYAYSALKEWLEAEKENTSSLCKKAKRLFDTEQQKAVSLTTGEIPQIARLVSMFEQRLEELRHEKLDGTWKPFEGIHKLGHDLCG